ncbi:MAG: HU family DNA-binding protein [Pseudomonadota bacterium]
MAAKSSSARAKKKTAARRATTKATKKTTKSKVAKRSTTKKATRAKASVKKVARSAKPLGKLKDAMTNSQVIAYLSEQTDIAKKDIKALFELFPAVIKAHIAKNGPGSFNFLGMMKVVTQHKPATKARKGINPFTGEEMVFKAKKARTVVKVRAMKKLKDLV